MPLIRNCQRTGSRSPRWSHLRREFFKIVECGDAPIASEAVARIAQIYAIERDMRGATAERNARRVARQARSRPLIDTLNVFLENQLVQLQRAAR